MDIATIPYFYNNYFTKGVSIGGEPACYIIEKHLSRFIEGQVSLNQSSDHYSHSHTEVALPPARSPAILN